jgi:DNA-binding IclR family transcriptional regulator
MIKVLYKAFAILELIADEPKEPKSVTELAEKSGLNQPTTVRILQDLVQMGYVEQISRSKGYILGPMPYQLASRGTYMEDVLKVAEPLIHNCAIGVQQSVLLAVLKSGKRFILCHENYNASLNIEIDRLYYKDFYETATGRVQLAYLSRKELYHLVETDGLPQQVWDWEHVTDISTLEKVLTDIRYAGFYRGDSPRSSLAVMAVPVFKDKQYVATLGASMPDFASEADKEHVFKKVQNTAKLITLGLSKASTFA